MGKQIVGQGGDIGDADLAVLVVVGGHQLELVEAVMGQQVVDERGHVTDYWRITGNGIAVIFDPPTLFNDLT